jgi:hypothetical protein
MDRIKKTAPTEAVGYSIDGDREAKMAIPVQWRKSADA